jgi:ComF family protein
MQSILKVLYPHICLLCDCPTDNPGLCPKCWADAPFIDGAACTQCGAPLLGEAAEAARCDTCITVARPWDQGRAVFTYDGSARKMVLRLKHGDRTDYAPQAAAWMVRSAQQMPMINPVLIPIPLHWTRRVHRRYNQAGLLAQAMAKQAGWEVLPRGLTRPRRTKVHENLSREERFTNMSNALTICPSAQIRRRDVLLIDDVMTSGATLAAGTEACRAAGAARVFVQVLARVTLPP